LHLPYFYTFLRCKKRLKKTEADNVYLKKLIFSQTTEKSKKKTKNDESYPEEVSPTTKTKVKVSSKTHGGQYGHTPNPRKIPSNLPKVECIHKLPEEKQICPNCKLPLKELNSEDISYEISYEIRYFLIEHRRQKYIKTCNCGNSIIRAPKPAKLFDGGLYSVDFWSKIIMDKYAYGIPLIRQIEIMSMNSLSIPKSTLCDGLYKIAQYLKPLYDLMLEKIAFQKLVHADETRWYNWQSSYNKKEDDKKALHWLWGFFSELYHVFVIDQSRSAKVVSQNFGQGESNTILPIFVTDRYKAYISACKVLAFCWAHVRRDFLKLQIKYKYDDKLYDWAQTYLNLISDLYALNSQRIKFSKGSNNFIAYQEQIQIIIDKMKNINTVKYKDPRKQKQAQSMINHWKGLTLFFEFPEIPLDNNLAERQLRKPVVGRKNFYGTHSDKSTKATAIFYSIITTCKLHNINPNKFLIRYLNFCANNKTPPEGELLSNFLPHNYAKTHLNDLL